MPPCKKAATSPAPVEDLRQDRAGTRSGLAGRVPDTDAAEQLLGAGPSMPC